MHDGCDSAAATSICWREPMREVGAGEEIMKLDNFDFVSYSGVVRVVVVVGEGGTHSKRASPAAAATAVLPRAARTLWKYLLPAKSCYNVACASRKMEQATPLFALRVQWQTGNAAELCSLTDGLPACMSTAFGNAAMMTLRA